MQRHRAALDAYIKRLLAQWAEEGAGEAPGVVVSRGQARAIDDGYYGAEPQDDRPDFVKEANEGWEPL